MGEDQDAAGARGLDEAERGDGLAGAGGVLEPEAAGGVRIVDQLVLGALLFLFLVAIPVERLVVVQLVVALELLLAGGQLLDRAPAVAVARLVALGLGHEGDQGARERIDLMGGEGRAVGQVGLLLGEQPLQAEQQRVLAPPVDRGMLAAGLDLGHRSVERAPAGRALGQRHARVLALEQERFTRELFYAFEVHARNWRGG